MDADLKKPILIITSHEIESFLMELHLRIAANGIENLFVISAVEAIDVSISIVSLHISHWSIHFSLVLLSLSRFITSD